MKKLKAKDVKKLSTDKKIDYIIDQLEKIDGAVNPSFVKRLIGWAGNHWFLVLALGGLTYFGIQLWDEVQALLGFVDGINQSIDSVQAEFTEVKSDVTNIKTRMSETIEGFKFWK